MIPTVDHWTGQQEAIRRFRVALEASWNDGTRLPHMLFVGGPGLGKTELAHVAAREMGDDPRASRSSHQQHGDIERTTHASERQGNRLPR